MNGYKGRERTANVKDKPRSNSAVEFYEFRCGNSDIEIYIRTDTRLKVIDGTAIQGKHLLGRTLQDVDDWLYVTASNLENAGVFIERINRQSGQNLS